MDRTFSRDDTKLMKGAAIVLMLMHHLWGFPGRIAGGELWHVLSICGESSLTYFGSFGKICVSFFFFLGGYGVYLSTHSKRYDLIAKLKGLYLSYWKVFVIFIPLAFFFCAHQPTYCDEAEICTRYAEFSRQECFNNFIGFSTSYNSEWWFLNRYICALILYPVIDRIVRRHSTLFNIWAVIIGTILITNVFPAIGELEVLGTLNDNYLYHAFFLLSAPYTACFWMGAVFAKGNLLIQLQDALRRNNLLHPVLDVFFIGVIIQLRSRLTEQTPGYDLCAVSHSILFGFAALYAAASLAAPAHRQGKHQHVAHSSVFLLLLLSRCKNSRCAALGHFVSACFTCAVLYRRAARPAVLAGHRQHDAAHTEDIS